MSEHAEKNHPIAGYVAAVIIGALLVLLVAVMNNLLPVMSSVAVIVSAILMIGWSVLALWIFTRKRADDH